MNRSCYKQKQPQPATRRILQVSLLAAVAFLSIGNLPARAGDEAPQWMHAAANAPVPSHDEDTDAVLLYAENNITLQSANSLRISIRRVYKILRPGGRDYGYVGVPLGPHKKLTGLRGWCIPATGKDFQVKDKDAVEVSLSGVEYSELINDVREHVIHIPAAQPGNVVGYEYEVEEQPLVLQDSWDFQSYIPVHEFHYSLELPSGWSYVAKWINHPEVQPKQTGRDLQWTLTDIQQIAREEHMPDEEAVAGRMAVYFVPPAGSTTNAFTDWKQMGSWYSSITADKLNASPELKQAVATVTAGAPSPLAKIQDIAQYVQHNFRYVAIELGIGGYQPHPAPEILLHRYGDCKDKATLAIAMLREIGVESYYVLINVHRGVVTADSPAYVGAFDHAIVAIRLPDAVADPSLLAIVQHPKYGGLLFFDPTNELTPFGEIGGYLQANFGLLVGQDGGELIQLPTQSPDTNTIQRSATLTLDSSGMLKGTVNEIRSGDRARSERGSLDQLAGDTERIKPIENLLAASLPDFRITSARIVNLHKTDLPFGFNYSFEAANYAKLMGGLILVRPRVIGVKARSVDDSKLPRQYPFEFASVALEKDSFDIDIPTGYVVDDLPPATSVDYSFGSYHSTTGVEGRTIHYRRSYEIKQLDVPVGQVGQLKTFYRAIAGDERGMVVLKPVSK